MVNLALLFCLLAEPFEFFIMKNVGSVQFPADIDKKRSTLEVEHSV